MFLLDKGRTFLRRRQVDTKIIFVTKRVGCRNGGGRWLLERAGVWTEVISRLDGGWSLHWQRKVISMTEELVFSDGQGWCPWRKKAVHEAEDHCVPNSQWRTHEIIHSLFLYIPGITQQHNWVYVYLGDRKTSWAFFIHLKFGERYQLGMNFSSKYSSV